MLERERSLAGTYLPLNDDLFVDRSRELELIRLALDEPRSGWTWIELRGPLGIWKSRLAEVALARTPRFKVIQATSRPTTAVRPFALMRRFLFALNQEFSGSTALPQTSEQFVTALWPLTDRLESYTAPDALWAERA